MYAEKCNIHLVPLTNTQQKPVTQVISMEQTWVISKANHVIVVDYFSFFIYKRPLPDMTLDTVILALKTIFSEAGVPTIPISDNGRQYCSEKFKEFSLQWSFVHKTASLYYPKGNEHTEIAIGVVKEVYTKCGDDFLLGLLVHKATPLLSSNKSPTKLFLGHKIATNIPCVPFGMAALVHCIGIPEHV